MIQQDNFQANSRRSWLFGKIRDAAAAEDDCSALFSRCTCLLSALLDEEEEKAGCARNPRVFHSIVSCVVSFGRLIYCSARSAHGRGEMLIISALLTFYFTPSLSSPFRLVLLGERESG